MMNPKRGLCLMLLLSILSTLGCAAVREPYLFKKKAPEKVEKPELDKQEELIRDLNMYTD